MIKLIMKNNFQKVISFILYLILFAFPFFFLNLTQEFYITNKFYLLGFGVLLLMVISTIEILISKKISWKKNRFDNMILFFLAAIGLSILFSSPNKIQALLDQNFGLVMMVSLTILYFYLSRNNEVIKQWNNVLIKLTSFILSLITMVFYFQPFKNINLPQAFIFLKNSGFTPLGSQLDLAIFLGFFAVFGIANMISSELKNFTKRKLITNYLLLILNLVALFLSVYSLIITKFILPPFRLSWYAAVETLKSPLTALFGVGINNFSSMFTSVKDVLYNQSNLWQINSFSLSRSTLLHIFTETGFFGLITFLFLLFSFGKAIYQDRKNQFVLFLTYCYLLFVLLFFPPSLPIFFLFFLTIASFKKTDSQNTEKSLDMSGLVPVYLCLVVFFFALIVGAGYFLGRSYLSERFFKKSIDGYQNNNVKEVYDNQRQAIILNPYIESFRINFSQTNLLIANNIASKTTQQTQTNSTNSNKLTDQDRQTITQAIQSAISEAKAATTLNPEKAENWGNLALVYRDVLSVAQGADAWAISAYQRAIVLDPQNPTYRLNLGGIYYTLKDYDQAATMFQQTISLKSDWANAYYNFAWASYQKADYQLAATEMQNVLTMIDQKTDETDYNQAQKDLVEFKKKLPVEKEATKSAEVKTGTLSLPSPPVTKISPKLELQKEASPGAK